MQCICSLAGHSLKSTLAANQRAHLFATRSVVIPASRFLIAVGGLPEPCPARQAFHGTGLACLAPSARGDLLAKVVRRLQCGGKGADQLTADPIPGFCHDGSPRGPTRAEYDWLFQGRRVECKSSMMQWCENRQLWKFQFSGVKFWSHGVQGTGFFDDLLIVLLTPRQIFVYLHDQAHGVVRTGARMAVSGHAIHLHGPAGERSWTRAVDRMISKLDESDCKCIAIVPLSHDIVNAEMLALAKSNTSSFIRISSAYHRVPLATLNPVARGKHIRRLVRIVDTVLHPGCHFECPVGSTRVNGSLRSAQQATYHWSRNGQRVACKSAGMSWDASRKRWKLYFSGVKLSGGQLPSFDELLLAMYTPRGLHIYRHDLEFCVSPDGVRTETHGHCITMVGIVGQDCWSEALDVILRKMEASRCERIALLEW